MSQPSLIIGSALGNNKHETIVFLLVMRVIHIYDLYPRLGRRTLVYYRNVGRRFSCIMYNSAFVTLLRKPIESYYPQFSPLQSEAIVRSHRAASFQLHHLGLQCHPQCRCAGIVACLSRGLLLFAGLQKICHPFSNK